MKDLELDYRNEAFNRAKEKLDTVSPSFCLAKWLQVTMHLHNGNTQSCHHVKSHRVDRAAVALNPARLHNTDEKIRAREKMLRGERPAECDYCWRVEDQGRLSDRIVKSADSWALPHFDEVVASGAGSEIVPRYVEISFRSTCQFKCMYCGPAYSTAWEEEIQRHGAYPTSGRFNHPTLLKFNGAERLAEKERSEQIESFWSWWPELSKKLEFFRVTGGEPLLAPETFRLLEWLRENPRPDLHLSINSNMGVPRALLDRLIEAVTALEGKIASFTLYTSVDTFGAQAAYIRFGMDFKTYRENCELFLKSVPWAVKLSYMITVNALSLPGMRDLMEMILAQRIAHQRHRIGLDTPYLRHPEHMAVSVLTPDFVEYLDRTLEFMMKYRAKTIAQGFVGSEILLVERIRPLLREDALGVTKRWRLRRDFYKMFTEYDRRRGTDFRATFPEYAEFWSKCRRLGWI